MPRREASSLPVAALAAAALLALIGALAAASQAFGGRDPSQLTLAGGETRLAYRGSVASPAALAHRAATAWGGRRMVAGGQTVEIHISDSYPEDEAVLQAWADYVASLVHGPEIERVTIYLGSFEEVQSVCGESALACYSPDREAIVSPIEETPNGISPHAALAHEYGHHVAANRRNPPWPAGDWGTKRWASAVNVCARTETGELVPGDQNREYERNPAEVFAETYRVLNERRLGRRETPWQIVRREFYPDAAALAALEQDVTAPWSGPTLRTVTGTFTSRGARTRRLTVATPLDGNAVATLRAPARARFTIELRSPSGTLLSRATTTGRAAIVRTRVCGTRTLDLRVTRVQGAGRYSVVVSTP